MVNDEVKLVLGDEYDEELREAVLQVLSKRRAIMSDGWRGIGGSQDIEVIKAKLGEDFVVIESETYVGISISGKKSIVDTLSQQIKEELKGGSIIQQA